MGLYQGRGKKSILVELITKVKDESASKNAGNYG